MSGKIIIINGTNGSGKSTLARAIISDCGGEYGVYELRKKSKVTLCNNGVAVLGAYETACGGLDTFSSWEDIQFCIDSLREWGVERILGEGVINYAYRRYLYLDSLFQGNLHYINLATPIQESIRNVIKRRHEAGNTKEFDPKNVYEKEKGMYSLYINLLENGLKNAVRLPFEQARSYIRQQFNLEGV